MKVSVSKADTGREFRRLDRLLAEVSQQSFVASKRAGDKYAAKVKSGIGTTSAPAFADRPWKPLSEAWKRQKKAHKEQFWLETGEIFKAIHTQIIKKALLFIHIFSGISRAKSGDDIINRAYWNEYLTSGPSGYPPRPIFRPAANLFSIVTGVKQRKLKTGSEEYLLFKLAVKNAIKKIYG